MRYKLSLFTLVLGLLIGVFAAEVPRTTGVLHIDHEKVAASFEKGSMLLTTNNFKIMTGRRTAPGEVEIHERDTDVFYIVDGSATFVVGGEPVAPRASGPGETRAKEVTGGEERRLTKGDIMVIPNGVPHWFKAVDNTFLYYVVKVSK